MEKILIHEVWTATHSNLELARAIARHLHKNWAAYEFQVEDVAGDKTVRIYFLHKSDDGYDWEVTVAEMRGFATAIETLIYVNF